MNIQSGYLSRLWGHAVVTEIAKYLILIIVAVFCIIPFFWVFSTALKSPLEITSTPLGLPQTPTFENFVQAWVKGRMGKYFLNSIIVSVPIVIFTVSLSSLAGYAFARHSFAGRNVIFYIFLIGLTLPFQSIMIPLYYTLVEFQILGTYWAMIIPQTALGLSFGVFIMRAFFQGMPAELEDAARVDGCNEFGVFWRVILPLASPGMVTLGIFSFLGAWNAFLLPLIFMQRDDLRPLSVGLMMFNSRYVRDFGMTMAGATIACLPILIIYVIFQRQFIRGLTAGALKG